MSSAFTHLISPLMVRTLYVSSFALTTKIIADIHELSARGGALEANVDLRTCILASSCKLLFKLPETSDVRSLPLSVGSACVRTFQCGTEQGNHWPTRPWRG